MWRPLYKLWSGHFLSRGDATATKHTPPPSGVATYALGKGTDGIYWHCVQGSGLAEMHCVSYLHKAIILKNGFNKFSKSGQDRSNIKRKSHTRSLLPVLYMSFLCSRRVIVTTIWKENKHFHSHPRTWMIVLNSCKCKLTSKCPILSPALEI